MEVVRLTNFSPKYLGFEHRCWCDLHNGAFTAFVAACSEFVADSTAGSAPVTDTPCKDSDDAMFSAADIITSGRTTSSDSGHSRRAIVCAKGLEIAADAKWSSPEKAVAGSSRVGDETAVEAIGVPLEGAAFGESSKGGSGTSVSYVGLTPKPLQSPETLRGSSTRLSAQASAISAEHEPIPYVNPFTSRHHRQASLSLVDGGKRRLQELQLRIDQGSNGVGLLSLGGASKLNRAAYFSSPSGGSCGHRWRALGNGDGKLGHGGLDGSRSNAASEWLAYLESSSIGSFGVSQSKKSAPSSRGVLRERGLLAVGEKTSAVVRRCWTVTLLTSLPLFEPQTIVCSFWAAAFLGVVSRPPRPLLLAFCVILIPWGCFVGENNIEKFSFE
nr:hypothetical protein Iba_chr02dCG4730 [Ipomoea batatas]